MFDFTNTLHGLGWPGENLTKFDNEWHGEIKWKWNPRAGLGFGRCVLCDFIVWVHHPKVRPVHVGVEMNTETWLGLKARTT